MTNLTVNVPKPKKLPRYVVQQTWADGKSFYRYNPPQKYVDSQVVNRINLGENLTIARQKAKEFNDAIDEYISNLEENISIERFPTLLGLSVEYKKSNDFSRLSDKSKKDYTSWGSYKLGDTWIHRKPVAKSNRMKAIGNGWTVSIINEIFKGIDGDLRDVMSLFDGISCGQQALKTTERS